MAKDLKCKIQGCNRRVVDGSEYCNVHYIHPTTAEEREGLREEALEIIGEIKRSDARRKEIEIGKEIVGWHNGIIDPDAGGRVLVAAMTLSQKYGAYINFHEARSLAYSAFWRTWKKMVGQYVEVK